jgi:hypothetical protein
MTETTISPDEGLVKGRAFIDRVSPIVERNAKARQMPPRLTAICLRALADAFDPPRERRARKFPDLPHLMDT